VHRMAGLTVVGIGAEGSAGLCDRARVALSQATVVVGSPRQLALCEPMTARTLPLPRPLLPGLATQLEELLARDQERVVVLASGDPMFYGIGATLIRLLGTECVDIVAHQSSASLAAARLGWPLESVAICSVVGRPLDVIDDSICPDSRLFVLSSDAGSPTAVAAHLTAAGFGPSLMTVLSQLGGPRERRCTSTAEQGDFDDVDDLNLIAIEARRAGYEPKPEPKPAARWPVVAGLPDDAYSHDGQLTKRDLRAITLSSLAPRPGQLLWDVGAGAGSVSIEWLRADPSLRAIAIESDPERADRIRQNSIALDVARLRVVNGRAPGHLLALAEPDAVFLGGGLSQEGVFDAAWAALRSGGRLVANAVTIESETLLAQWRAEFGGELTRIAISRSSPVGRLTGWRPAMPVTQWIVTKP